MAAMVAQHFDTFTQFAQDIMELRYSHVVNGRKETWEDIAKRVVLNVMSASGYVGKDILSQHPGLYKDMVEVIAQRKFIPGGRILSQAGRAYHQTDSCFTLRAEDTREGWASLAEKCTLMLMSGGGVGVDYSQLRPYGSPLQRSGGIASGPLPLIEMVNSIAASVRQGGERRGACYASLAWDHADVDSFIKMKVDASALQHTNISVRFTKRWQEFVEDNVYNGNVDAPSYKVFLDTLKHACMYGDPGFQFDYDEQILRNACTEIISSDDSDSCCIGSVNFATIGSIQELRDVVTLAILFLLCNTLYTEFPTDKVRQVKEKNRRLGLGIMGIGEWFMQRGLAYGYTGKTVTSRIVEQSGPFNFQAVALETSDIKNWMQCYKDTSIIAALQWSSKLNVKTPIAVRAIAPTGTISIVGGYTTPGIEPIFHTAYQRTYNTLKTPVHSNGYRTETVIDPIVQKWLAQGYDVRDIDTAYTLSQSVEGIERRLAFQAFVQSYVDNAVSSTINLPKYTEGIEDKIAPMLLRYLPKLRGVTFYPDGRHAYQPVVPVDIKYAMQHDNGVMVEHESCKGGVCGN